MTATYNGLKLGVGAWEKLGVDPDSLYVTGLDTGSKPWGTTVSFVGNHSVFPRYGCNAIFLGAFAGHAFFNTWRGPPEPLTESLSTIGWAVDLYETIERGQPKNWG